MSIISSFRNELSLFGQVILTNDILILWFPKMSSIRVRSGPENYLERGSAIFRKREICQADRPDFEKLSSILWQHAKCPTFDSNYSDEGIETIAVVPRKIIHFSSPD